jgi:ABC-2 type transport system ATP-binding protein
MSSHVLSEVNRVCDRIGLLRRGMLILLSEVQEVRKLAARTVHVIFDAGTERRPGPLPAGHEVLSVKPGLWTVRIEGSLQGLLQAIEGLPVKDLEVEEPRLEDVLLKYYREEVP